MKKYIIKKIKLVYPLEHNIDKLKLGVPGEYKCFVEGEWRNMCACENCGEVHLVYEYSLKKTDEKIKCCIKPNNHYTHFGAAETIAVWVKNNI